MRHGVRDTEIETEGAGMCGHRSRKKPQLRQKDRERHTDRDQNKMRTEKALKSKNTWGLRVSERGQGREETSRQGAPRVGLGQWRGRRSGRENTRPEKK